MYNCQRGQDGGAGARRCRRWEYEGGQALQQQSPLDRRVVDGLEIVLSPQAAATEAYHQVDPTCATKTRNDRTGNETQTRGGGAKYTRKAHITTTVTV